MLGARIRNGSGAFGDECGSTSVWSWFIAGSRAQSVEQCGVDSCSLPGEGVSCWTSDYWWCKRGEVPKGAKMRGSKGNKLNQIRRPSPKVMVSVEQK